MSWYETEMKGMSSPFTNTSAKYSFVNFVQKPIEVYVFIDPLCLDCWSLEPYLNKLSLEYGRFFMLRPIIDTRLNILNDIKSNQHSRTNKKFAGKPDEKLSKDSNHVLFPWVALAIKAAELQGKSAGRAFLRKMQVNYFLKERDISDHDVLIHCAKDAKLDIHEFEKDLFSKPAKKAIQCDMKLKKEMGVDSIPSIVFFNQIAEHQGIKISGLHSYKTYVHILKEMLQQNPIPTEKPSLEDFLAFYDVATINDIAIIFDLTISEAERKIKKLQLKQKVELISASNGYFWKYVK